MSLTDAQQAVFDYLVAEPGPALWSSPSGPGGWVTSAQAGGGEGADPATVEFRKSRTFPGCQLHSVDFASREHGPGSSLARSWQEPDGSWTASPIGGGGGGGPHRRRPWVNFAAQWNAELFAAGGHVIGAGADQARLVRLVFADGTELSDSVDNGVVLFFTAPAWPSRPGSRSSAARARSWPATRSSATSTSRAARPAAAGLTRRQARPAGSPPCENGCWVSVGVVAAAGSYR